MPFDPTTPHRLATLPPAAKLESPEVMKALLRARTELAELKGYSLGVPNPLLLISPAVIKEAIASSEIENINTTMMDVLQNQLLPEADWAKPDKEVLHYREAILWGFEKLPALSLSTRLILGIKDILVPDKPHGYRQQQNRIANSTTGETIYTPPIAPDVPRLIGDLEDYLHQDDDIDPLVKCAVMHYQFEAIHPFEDGNGRAGRILMVLYLIKEKILHYPILFMSGYLLRDRKRYYELLLDVTRRDTWQEFTLFMLEGFYQQAKETKELLLKITGLFLDYKTSLKAAAPGIYSTELVEKLFAYPVINPSKLEEELGISYPTALKYLEALRSGGFLDDQRVGRYHLYVNSKLMKLLRPTS